MKFHLLLIEKVFIGIITIDRFSYWFTAYWCILCYLLYSLWNGSDWIECNYVLVFDTSHAFNLKCQCYILLK